MTSTTFLILATIYLVVVPLVYCSLTILDGYSNKKHGPARVSEEESFSMIRTFSFMWPFIPVVLFVGAIVLICDKLEKIIIKATDKTNKKLLAIGEKLGSKE